MKVRYDDGHFKDKELKRKRMNGKRHPNLLFVPQYLMETMATKEKLPHDAYEWGYPMHDDLAEIVGCQACKTMSTTLGAYLNDWKGRISEVPSMSPCDTWLWTCSTCCSDTLEFNCARCEFPVFKDSQDLGHPFCQAHGEEDEMWCVRCMISPPPKPKVRRRN